MSERAARWLGGCLKEGLQKVAFELEAEPGADVLAFSKLSRVIPVIRYKDMLHREHK